MAFAAVLVAVLSVAGLKTVSSPSDTAELASSPVAAVASAGTPGRQAGGGPEEPDRQEP